MPADDQGGDFHTCFNGSGPYLYSLPLSLAQRVGQASHISICGLISGPWWLVRKGRLDDAKAQLQRLATKGYYTEQKLDEAVALMVHTNEMEKAEVAGTGFTDCFRGTNRRRTEIVGDWPSLC